MGVEVRVIDYGVKCGMAAQGGYGGVLMMREGARGGIWRGGSDEGCWYGGVLVMREERAGPVTSGGVWRGQGAML